MNTRIDYLGTLRSLHEGAPRRLCALLGCSFGLAGRRAPLTPKTAFELSPFLIYFLEIDRLRASATAHLVMSLSERDREQGVTFAKGLDRNARVAGLAGTAYSLVGATEVEFADTMRRTAAAFELDEDSSVEAAQLLAAVGHNFEVVEHPFRDRTGAAHATFHTSGGPLEITWKPIAYSREPVTSYYPFGDEQMTPRESFPIDEPLRQLASRYPWPQVCPKNPFDRRGWFADTHREALLRFLPKRPALILEIGSLLGASLRFMMEIRPGSFFISVDPFSIARHGPAGIRVHDFRDNFYVNCWNYRDRLIAVPKESADALPELGELGVRPDAVYIDGQHNYAAVMRDARLTLSLNRDALLIGDDYSDPESVKCGLQLAVKQLAQETGRELQTVDGHVWILEPRAS